VLAAHAAGVETLILPRPNERDLREVPAAMRRDLSFQFVDHMEELLEIALVPVEQAAAQG
jgi:ATP-dependent Lon protease